ncbi:MAG TPA: pyridoxal-phosphate dependent enzyme [Bacteroidales bacterium]|jgi:threonine dehydratase|nr:pyridoxal-phosphate dependent enzyme [Bacteroidales bacterium]
MQNLPSFTDVRQAHVRIADFIHRTPVLSSSGINDITGASVFFKCENFQKVGAFKYRGATNAVFSLPEHEAIKGVATHSSGNHAAALALAAAKRGIKCDVVMPRTAPPPKIEAVRHYGANITFCEPTLKSREETLASIISQSGAILIHPYDNFNVICGQGTAAKELMEEVGDLDVMLAPVGGGGLLSGTSLSAKSVNPAITVYGCEPANADDAYRSFNSGTIHPSVNPKTIADGLLTSLSVLTFTMIRKYVDAIYTVSEEAIIEAMELVWKRMKIIIEPSSAVPLAVVLQNKDTFRGKKVGIILSGGNVDLTNLPFRLA